MHPMLFATTNENKVREVREILGDAVEQVSIDLLEPQGIRVEDVVRIKAKDAFRQAGKPTLVEDTGLEIAAWNGLPGALISWFLDTVGNEGILTMLADETGRAAIAKTAIGFFDGKKDHLFVGEVSGTISNTICGTKGFGWDPIFIPDGYDASFAEMNSADKNAISMRKRALEHMKTNFT